MRSVGSWCRDAVQRRAVPSGLLVAAVALLVATGVLLPLRDRLALPSISLLFLIPVALTAVLGDLWSSLVAVAGAALVVNFFFVPPYRTLVVASSADLVLLCVYLLVAAAISLAVDVALRYRETAGRLSEIDRLRTTLLAAVSHDLRTPLAGIKASVSALREPDVTIPAAEQRELLATVEESADRLTGVVDNLLSASRLQAGRLSLRLEPVALDGVAASALVNTGVDADLEVPDDLPLVLADAGLLEQVIGNLVRNARQADPSGRVVLTGRVCDGRAELAVVDHGPGVPEADRAAMFAPFHRLDDASGGLGLGLTVVKGFTEAMHGTVTPSTTPGGGLTMTLSLPLARDGAR
jgi:two-component system sensor histidine kinase KdpD